MSEIHIGCGQITWIKFTPNGAEWLASEEQVLAEIAQAGYAGAPAGPERDRSAQETIELYERYGLRPAPGYVGAAFWDTGQRDEILERVRRHAAFAREVGCTELYVAPSGFDYVTRSGQTRRETAGHVRPDDSLSDDEFQIFGETLSMVGEITLREGVRSCFHNHVGTPIETRAEIDRLLALTDPNLVFLGPDTGHLAWAGVDPVVFCRDYASRTKTLHLTCNEFGVYRRKSKPEHRNAWLRDVRTSLEQHNIGWTMWDYAGGFNVVTTTNERREVDRETAEALGLA